MTTATLYMIDRAGTRDRDDAFRVDLLPGGGWRLEVHIAAVSDMVPIGSRSDQQANLRLTSRYLPGRTIPMLGERVEQAATLCTHEERPSLAVSITYSPQGQAIETTLARASLPAGTCVALDHAEAARAVDDPRHPHHADLVELNTFAQTLIGVRRDSGGLVLYDLLQGWAASEDGAIVAIPEAQRTSAYIIVQEAMIATNEAIAMWCVREGLPILFRNHQANPTASTAEDFAADLAVALADPMLMAKVRGRLSSSLRPATYGPTAQSHFGLRLAAYTHSTSPLRRVADLISQRILLAHIDGAGSPYRREQLVGIAVDINRRTAAARAATDKHFKAVQDRELTAAAAGDLFAVDPKQFKKMLKVAAGAGVLPPRLDVEIRRRLGLANELTAPDIAVILTAAHTTWQPLQTYAIDSRRETRPEFAPSIISALRQLDPTCPEATMQTISSGPSHRPLFAAQATHREVPGLWQVRPSKKAAEYAALWAALRAHVTGEPCADLEPRWPAPAPAPVADTPSFIEPAPAAPRPPVAPCAPRPPALTDAAALTVPSRKAKALKNPVAWLVNYATVAGLPDPIWEFEKDGPAHAPTYLVTVDMGWLRAQGRGPGKSSAKKGAAEALIEALFAEAEQRG